MTLVSTMSFGPGEERDVISGLSASGEYLYWHTENGYVMRAPLDGSTITTVASDQFVSAGLAVDSQHLYWSTGGTSDGQIVAMPLTGGALVTLANSGANGIAVNATFVAWTRAYEADQGSVLVGAK